MELKDTIPIIFNQGAYGTYLEWCLNTLTNDDTIVVPLLDDGSSHGYLGRHLLNIAGWESYVQLGQPSRFVRLHPKVLQTECIKSNLELMLSTVSRAIFLYPDRDSVVLNINNMFYKKALAQHWQQQHQTIIHAIHNNWPVDRDIKFDDIPTWIKREFLSFYLMPMWFDQVEWFFPDTWTHNRCQIVYIKDLLYDFENTLNSLKKFLKLSFHKEISQLVAIHNDMLAQQQHIGQDALCNQIVDCTLHNTDFSWQKEYLSLASESWIQWKLRESGYELACHNLNIFPTNNTNLKRLIYPR